MKEYTVPGWQANLISLLFGIPAILIGGIPFVFIWCESCNGFSDSLRSVILQNRETLRHAIDSWWWLLVVLIGGIILHELIHGICMAAFAKKGWKSVSFGFNLQALAPYAHCKEPLKPDAYRISLIMPGLLLGDMPVIISWFTGNILFLFFGILFTWSAAGDLIIFWKSCKINDGYLQDHPEKIGFIHITDPQQPLIP